MPAAPESAAAESAAALLRAQGATIAVSESAAGGLISAALLAIPGASDYFLGGAVVYTLAARALIETPEAPATPGMRGASEEFALYEARSVRAKTGAAWGVGETGAAGPSGNRYGDPAGHAWVAVVGPDGAVHTRRVGTGSADRAANMAAFAQAALELLVEALGEG
ncbi:MAG: CinA family protein [Acidimicrobiales bacterium]